eukprot:Awhi_evm1s10693
MKVKEGEIANVKSIEKFRQMKSTTYRNFRNYVLNLRNEGPKKKVVVPEERLSDEEDPRVTRMEQRRKNEEHDIAHAPAAGHCPRQKRGHTREQKEFGSTCNGVCFPLPKTNYVCCRHCGNRTKRMVRCVGCRMTLCFTYNGGQKKKRVNIPIGDDDNDDDAERKVETYESTCYYEYHKEKIDMYLQKRRNKQVKVFGLEKINLKRNATAADVENTPMKRLRENITNTLSDTVRTLLFSISPTNATTDKTI